MSDIIRGSRFKNRYVKADRKWEERIVSLNKKGSQGILPINVI